MAEYVFNKVLVYGSNPGGIVRLARSATITVVNDATGAALFTVTSDAQGRASFTTTDVPSVRLRDNNSGFESDPITAPSVLVAAANQTVSEDNAVAALLSNGSSSTRASLNTAMGGDVTGLVPKLDNFAPKDQRDLLRQFYAALGKAKASAGACDIVTITDSIGEGVGVTTSVEKRWLSQFRDQIRTRHGLTGGRGYVPCQYAFTTPDAQPWTLSGGAAVSSNDYYGLGRRVSTLTASGHTATLSVTGHTSLQLVAVGGTGFGSFSWKVDSGTATTINCAGLGYTSPTEFTVDVSLPDQNAHTVTVTWVSGAVWLCGAMLYKLDEVNGLRLWEGGHTGATSAYFTDSTYGWWTSVTRIAPALVIIALGTNDWNTLPISTTKANLGTIIDNVRAKVTNPPSILLVGNYARNGMTGDVGAWADRVQAMRDLSNEKTVAFLDLNRRMGSASSNTLGMFNADLIHPSNSGSQVIAQAVLDYLENPIP